MLDNQDDQVAIRCIRPFGGWKPGQEWLALRRFADVWIARGHAVTVHDWRAVVAAASGVAFSPLKADQLANLTLAAALRQAVMGDAKVIAASVPAVMEYPELQATLNDATFPTRWSISTLWPVQLTADDLLSAFCRRSGYMILGGPDPDDTITKPSVALETFFNAVAGCWQRVTALLDGGQLQLFDWTETKISQRMLQSLLIDLATSDLFERDKEDQPLRKEVWLSLAVGEAAVPMDAANLGIQTITSIATKAATAPSLLDISKLPKALQSIHVAVMELWQGTVPDLLRAGQRDQKIIDYLKSRPDLSTASSSSIKRYMQEYKAAAARRRAPRDRS